MTIKTLYYPTDAQIYNSWIQLELLQNASLDCAVHARTMGKYAAITPTTSMSTDAIEPLL